MDTEPNKTSDRVEISKKLVLINSASSLVTRMLSISVLIWLQQYLLKRITPEEYSLLPVLYSVMMFAPLITTILTSGLGRYILEAYAKHDDERVTQIVSTMFPMLCATGLVFLAGGWTFAWHIDKVLNIAPERLWDARIMMALLMFSAAVRLPLSPFAVGLYVRQKFVLQNLIQVGTTLFSLTLLFTLLFGVSTRVMWLITASVCGEMLNLAIVLIVSRRLVPTLRFRLSHIHWPIAKELTSFGGWSFLVQVATTLKTSADIIILNLFSTAFDVTCFHLGVLPRRHIHQFSMMVRVPLEPVVIAMYANRSPESLTRVFIRGGRVALWASLFVSVPAMVYSREFIVLYVGEQYLRVSVIIPLMLATLTLEFPSVMTGQLATARAEMRPCALRVLLMSIGAVLLSVFSVGVLKLGALGPALSSFVVLGLGTPLLMWPLGRRMANVDPATFLREILWPGLFPGFAGFFAWEGLRFAVHPDTWVSLILCCFLGGLVYVAVLFLYCLGEPDIRDLRAIWERTRSVLHQAIPGNSINTDMRRP